MSGKGGQKETKYKETEAVVKDQLRRAKERRESRNKARVSCGRIDSGASVKDIFSLHVVGGGKCFPE